MIINNIIIGGIPLMESSQDYRDFFEKNANYIILIGEEYEFPSTLLQNIIQFGIQNLFFSIQKDIGILLDQQDNNITKIVQFIQQAIREDAIVYITSPNGSRRCALAMCSYLIHRYHWPVIRAVQYVKAFRPEVEFVVKNNIIDLQDPQIRQLADFALRRSNKYGKLKDIFGQCKNMKLNSDEQLMRNTYLNLVGANYRFQQNNYVQNEGGVDILKKLNYIQVNKSNVTWIDGLSGYNDNCNYALQRPQGISYRKKQGDDKQTNYFVNKNLLPFVSFDIKYSKGVMQNNQIGVPVSIMKVVPKTPVYLLASFYVTGKEFEQILLKIIRQQQIKQVSISKIQTQPQQQITTNQLQKSTYKNTKLKYTSQQQNILSNNYVQTNKNISQKQNVNQSNNNQQIVKKTSQLQNNIPQNKQYLNTVLKSQQQNLQQPYSQSKYQQVVINQQPSYFTNQSQIGLQQINQNPQRINQFYATNFQETNNQKQQVRTQQTTQLPHQKLGKGIQHYKPAYSGIQQFQTTQGYNNKYN